MAQQNPPTPSTKLDATTSSPIPIFESLLTENEKVVISPDSLQGHSTWLNDLKQAVGVGLNLSCFPETDLDEVEVNVDNPCSLELSSISSVHPANFRQQYGAYSYAHPDTPKTVRGHQDLARFYVVDLRGKEPGLIPFSQKTIRLSSPDDQRENKNVDVASHFDCNKMEILEIENKDRDPFLIIGAHKVEKVLIVDLTLSSGQCNGCLLLSTDATLSWGLNACQQWVRDLLGRQSALRSKMCLFQGKKRLDEPHDLQVLPNWARLELIRLDSWNLKFLCRLTQHSEKTFFMDCHNTDYIWEVIDKFKQIYAQEQNESLTSSQQLWLINRDRILVSNELLKDVWNPFVLDNPFVQKSHATIDIVTDDTFYVYFKPPGGVVLIKLNYKSDVKKHFKSESSTLLSEQASPQELREEISKVIHKDSRSFKILVNGKKIEQNTDLVPLLKHPSYTFVVEQRSQIHLKVIYQSSHQEYENLSVDLHKYNLVSTLKQQVCNHLNLPSYCVDLTHRNDHLDESTDLRGCRLRNGDTVEAQVFPHRICMRIRLRQSLWEDVVVDDVTALTVEHLKSYVIARMKKKSLFPILECDANEDDKRYRCHPGIVNIKILLNGKVLEGCASLRDAGLEMNCRILVVTEESLCYTASISARRIPVIMCPSNTDTCVAASPTDRYRKPVRVMAMSDGKMLYFSNPPEASLDVPQELFEGITSNLPQVPAGIGPCRKQLQALFAADATQSLHRSTLPCKSNTLPVFPSTPSSESSMSHNQCDSRSLSQSDTFPRSLSHSQSETFRQSSLSHNQSDTFPRSLSHNKSETFPQSLSHSQSETFRQSSLSHNQSDTFPQSLSHSQSETFRQSSLSHSQSDTFPQSLSDSQSETFRQSSLSHNQSDTFPQSLSQNQSETFPRSLSHSQSETFRQSSLSHNQSDTFPQSLSHSQSETFHQSSLSHNQFETFPRSLSHSQSETFRQSSLSHNQSDTFPRSLSHSQSETFRQSSLSQNQSETFAFQAQDNCPESTHFCRSRERQSFGPPQLQSTPTEAKDIGNKSHLQRSFAPGTDTNQSCRTRHQSDYTPMLQPMVINSLHFQQSLECDGRIKSMCIIENSQFSQEQMKRLEKFHISDALSNFPLVQNSNLAITSSEEMFSSPVMPYQYIPKNILLYVATELHACDFPIIIGLLPVKIIEQIKEKHRNNLATQYFYFLVAWCHKEGRSATVDTLKQALKNGDRNDIADGVDCLLAKDKGYETSP